MKIRLKSDALYTPNNVREYIFLTLVDEKEEYYINIVSPRITFNYIRNTIGSRSSKGNSLIHILYNILNFDYGAQLEIVIYGINNGQYKSYITDNQTLQQRIIDISQAAPLIWGTQVPIYIEEHIWEMQKVKLTKPRIREVSFHINAIPNKPLKRALKQAIKNEDYLEAKRISDELNKRTDD